MVLVAGIFPSDPGFGFPPGSPAGMPTTMSGLFAFRKEAHPGQRLQVSRGIQAMGGHEDVRVNGDHS